MEPLRKASPHEFRNDDKLIKEIARTTGMSLEEATKHVMDEDRREAIWINEKYQVAVIRFTHDQFGPCMQLNIRRRDGKPIFRDWRDFQAIKNQLAGPEYEGFELYPAESRKIDMSNKYHLFVILDANVRIPFGWMQRDVREPQSDIVGMRQRPLPASDPESKRHKQ